MVTLTPGSTTERPFDCISEFLFIEHPASSADIILVPGGSAPELMQRAVELYHAGLAPYILPSGGPNPMRLLNWASEWAFLRNIALQAGVPDEAILREDRARNTMENARFSWAVLVRAGLPVATALLVCKAHHSRRALLTYQAVFPVGTRFWVSPIVDYRGIRKDNWFLDTEKTRIVFQEVEKIGKYLGPYVPKWAGDG